jgi:hypothetical protein
MDWKVLGVIGGACLFFLICECLLIVLRGDSEGKGRGITEESFSLNSLGDPPLNPFQTYPAHKDRKLPECSLQVWKKSEEKN